MEIFSEQPQETVVFILAHCDDEFFALPAISLEKSSGKRVVCIYITDGSAYGEDPERRLAESYAVLFRKGVRKEDIIPLGILNGIHDGCSFRFLAQLWDSIISISGRWHISQIYMPAWEGGHPDHEAGHLLGAALAKKKGVEAYEFSLYNSDRLVGPLFRCMTLIPAAGAQKKIKVSLREALIWLFSVRHYHSQWKTFLGLLSFCVPQILFKRELQLRRIEPRDYQRAPHKGKLLYEKRFKIPYKEFAEATLPFIKRHL